MERGSQKLLCFSSLFMFIHTIMMTEKCFQPAAAVYETPASSPQTFTTILGFYCETEQMFQSWRGSCSVHGAAHQINSKFSVKEVWFFSVAWRSFHVSAESRAARRCMLISAPHSSSLGTGGSRRRRFDVYTQFGSPFRCQLPSIPCSNYCSKMSRGLSLAAAQLSSCLQTFVIEQARTQTSLWGTAACSPETAADLQPSAVQRLAFHLLPIPRSKPSDLFRLIALLHLFLLAPLLLWQPAVDR